MTEYPPNAAVWEIRPCAAPSPDPVAHGLPLQCEGQAGHGGDHYALRGSVTWPAGGEKS